MTRGETEFNSEPKPFDWNKVGTIKDEEKPWIEEFDRLFWDARKCDEHGDCIKAFISQLLEEKDAKIDFLKRLCEKETYKISEARQSLKKELIEKLPKKMKISSVVQKNITMQGWNSCLLEVKHILEYIK